MCSLHLTHLHLTHLHCTHLEQWAADCAAPGEQSWTSCWSWDSNPQPWVTSGFKSNALSIRPTTALCISLGPADCRERLSYSVWRSATTFQRSISHISESQAGSGIRTRSYLSLEEGGHRGGPSSRQRVRVLQPGVCVCHACRTEV